MTKLDGSGALRTRLGPVLDHVARQPGARKLRMIALMADNFVLGLVISHTPRVATALQLWIAELLASEREDPLEVERLSPYPLDPIAAGPDQVEPQALADLVFTRLTAPEPGGQPGSTTRRRAVFLDAARAGVRDAEAWRRLFLRLNERRNLIARDLKGPLIVLLPPLLELEIPRLAPDLWSVRSVTVELEDFYEVPEGARMIQAFESSYQAAQDIDALIQEVDAARERARAGSTASLRALGVLLLRLAGAKQLAGELTTTEALVDEVLTLTERLADPGTRAAALLARGDLFLRRGQLDDALQHTQQAIELLAKGADPWALAQAQGQIADILEARGQLDDALRIRKEEELPVYDRLGDVRERAVTMGRIADILEARGQLDDALRIRKEEQLPVYDRLGDVRPRAVTMGQIADILLARGQLDDALRIHKEQLPVYDRLGDVRSRALTMGRIADILLARGQLDDALRIRKEEEFPVYDRLGDVRSRAVTRVKIALLLHRRQRPEDTEEIHRHLLDSLAAAREHGFPVEASQIERICHDLGIPISSEDPSAPQ